VNLAYSDFKYKDFKYQSKVTKGGKDSLVEADYSGKAVAGVSPIMANVGVDIFTKPGIYASATYSYRDAMPFTSDGENMTEAFSLVNAKLGFRRNITNHWNIDAYLGANNITGSQYYQMVFVNQLPDAYIPAPNEINFFGGVNLKYNF
jgi:iron complex outermembrane receptor protein